MRIRQYGRTFWILALTALLSGPVVAQFEPPITRPQAAARTIDIDDQRVKTSILTVAVHAWAPWAGPNLQSMGTLPHMVSEIMSSDNTQVRFRFVHWGKALDMLSNQEADAAIVWVSADLRLDPFLMSNPLQEQRAALYFNKAKPYSADISTITMARLAWQKEYVYEFDVFRQIDKSAFKPVAIPDERAGLLAVADREADIFIAPWSVARDELKKLDATKRNALGYVLLKNNFPPAFFLVNKSAPDSEVRMKRFNQGLRRLQMDGRYQNILQK